MPSKSLVRVAQQDKVQLSPIQLEQDVTGVLSTQHGGTGPIGVEGQVLTVVSGLARWGYGTPGPTGATGAPGTIGPRGIAGADGVAGAAGANGTNGAPGPQGMQGSMGPPGSGGGDVTKTMLLVRG